MRKILLFSVVLISLFVSCENKPLDDKGVCDQPVLVDRLSFDSPEAFEYAMLEMSDSDFRSLSGSLKASLFSPVSSLNIEDDPILSCDFQDIPQVKATDVKSLFELGGYEDLVPEERLARLLNARAEIEIGGRVYKISPEGTYFFRKSFESGFNDKYSRLKNLKGTRIDDMTELLETGIFRYDTFRSDRPDPNETISLTYQAPTASGPTFGSDPVGPTLVSQLQLLNFNAYPKYCSDAKTWLGNIIQSLVGRNKSFDYSFSKDRRFTAKLYYYDYLFWTSIGAVTKYQKKGFLGIWGKTAASEIYLAWSDIILETDIKGNPLELPKNAGPITVVDKIYNKNTARNENVAYVLGLYVKQEDIEKAIGAGLKSLLSTIRSKTGVDVSGKDKITLVGPQKYYTIIPHSGSAKKNVAELSESFYFDPSIYISNTLLQSPSGSGGWLKWLAELIKGYIDLPNTRLVCGAIQTAVETPNGEIGAMTIYKPKK
ncbi:MAG: hypothetical protein IKX28_05110 [Bacteroidales bacterium]|nr:hypothetical protein [Bacteroidales bacterium]